VEVLAEAGKKDINTKESSTRTLFCVFWKTLFLIKMNALAQTEAASFLVPIFHREKKDIADGWIKLLNKIMSNS
jgi:hypothetical protein